MSLDKYRWEILFDLSQTKQKDIFVTSTLQWGVEYIFMVAQVRKNKGAFWTDKILWFTEDWELHSFENMWAYSVKDEYIDEIKARFIDLLNDDEFNEDSEFTVMWKDPMKWYIV